MRLVRLPRRQIARISIGLSILTLLAAAAVLVQYVLAPAPAWLPFAPAWGSLYLDPLSAIMMFAVAGISLVTNYRETFAQEVRNGGIDGLITTLADKNKQVDAKNEKKS